MHIYHCRACVTYYYIYKAKGKFIAFLDDDDEYRKDKIEWQLKGDFGF